MKQNVVPIQSHPSTEQLAEMWLDAKRLEMQAIEKRIVIEKSIIDRVGFREEGSKTTTLDNGVKITITGKLTYKAADFAAFKKACQQLDREFIPIKVVESVDETGVKWMRANAPQAYCLIADTLTITPAKTSVSVRAA